MLLLSLLVPRSGMELSDFLNVARTRRKEMDGRRGQREFKVYKGVKANFSVPTYSEFDLPSLCMASDLTVALVTSHVSVQVQL